MKFKFIHFTKIDNRTEKNLRTPRGTIIVPEYNKGSRLKPRENESIVNTTLTALGKFQKIGTHTDLVHFQAATNGFLCIQLESAGSPKGQ